MNWWRLCEAVIETEVFLSRYILKLLSNKMHSVAPVYFSESNADVNFL